jgi:4a-hydroxytetrahydrobiopterin dehydratase
MSVPEGWSEEDNALVREFSFGSYLDGVEFARRVAEVAERENHHPDLDIRYKRVIVRWSTHSAGGVTDRDRELAARTSELT